jgi:hypothetical protein
LTWCGWSCEGVWRRDWGVVDPRQGDEDSRGLAIVDCTLRAKKCVVLDGGCQRKGWRLHWINNDVMVMLKMLVSHMWLMELTESGTLSRHRFLPSSIVNCRQVLVYRDK